MGALDMDGPSGGAPVESKLDINYIIQQLKESGLRAYGDKIPERILERVCNILVADLGYNPSEVTPKVKERMKITSTQASNLYGFA